MTRTILFIPILAFAIVFTPILSADINNDKSTVFSRVENPSIPQSMNFAGQKINFDRTDMYERLDRELTAMSYTHGNTLLIIKRANRYFPILSPILKQNGIPSDMIYLACIESTLNIRAYSPAKAAGLWQFIATTAKRYGLEVNDYVDERYHIEKSTIAACKYFQDAYEKYGNWESVAASYNGGMARISKELEAQNVQSAYDLHLVDETSRYIYRLLAMKIIMENPGQYGYRLTSDQLYQPVATTEIKINQPISDWPTWAKNHGITYMQLREFNPWIRAKELPNKTGKTYTIKIPVKNELYRSTQTKECYNPNWVID